MTLTTDRYARRYGQDPARLRRRYSYVAGWHTAVTAAVNPPAVSVLRAELTRPAYTVRFRWTPGSVAVRDDRATAHLAPADLDHLDVRRTLHRVTVIGDRPVGPDGRESGLVAGRPFTADHVVVAD
jgi:taurine dioxygenase